MEILKGIKGYFESRFWKSCREVTLLSIFTFLPLIINIIIAVIPATSKSEAFFNKIIPGELVAYSLGFITPLFILIIKILKEDKNNYKLPFVTTIFVTSLMFYLLAILLSLIAKNNLISGIDLKPGHAGYYFGTCSILLIFTIFLRIYTAYHNSNFSDFQNIRNTQQSDFNNIFRNNIK